MESGATTELLLIRHAPAITAGRLCGRTDVAADCGDDALIARTRLAIGKVDHISASPALRCRQTVCALWPEISEPGCDAALWEQDFGDWEGQNYADLPDLGALSGADLAAHRPPGGESFADLCDRVIPALITAAGHGGRIALVAHAGVVRAGLAMALGSVPLALSFDVAPLSVTRLRAVPGGGWAILSVNWTPT